MKRLSFIVILFFIISGSAFAVVKSSPTIKCQGEDYNWVLVGKTFTVTLEANHTTGYVWQLAGDLKKKNIQLISNSYTTNHHAKNMVGMGGREEWTFKALKVGAGTITFKLVRPWEKNIKPIDVRTFEVRTFTK